MKKFLKRMWCILFHMDDEIVEFAGRQDRQEYTWRCRSCGEMYTYRDYID